MVDDVAVLQVSDLAAGYAGKVVTRLPQLSLPKSSSVLLMGPSGCGKTTLLLTLAGLARPLSGSVEITGINPVQLPAAERDRFRGRNLGFVFQNVNLVAGLTVLENVLLGAFAAGVPQDRARACELLERMGLSWQLQQRAEKLSRGQAQRVAIARAMLLRPKIILCDEPTASLDDENCAAVADLLSLAMTETQASLVIATHDRRLRERFPVGINVQAAA